MDSSWAEPSVKAVARLGYEFLNRAYIIAKFYDPGRPSRA